MLPLQGEMTAREQKGHSQKDAFLPRSCPHAWHVQGLRAYGLTRLRAETGRGAPSTLTWGWSPPSDIHSLFSQLLASCSCAMARTGSQGVPSYIPCQEATYFS